MTNFRDSSIYKYLTKILDAGFILFQENILEDENIDTAWRPHVHKGWEIKFYAPDEGQLVACYELGKKMAQLVLNK